MERRSVKILYVCTAFLAAGLAMLGYSYFIEPTRLVINNSELAIKDWNTVFDGLRIVAIKWRGRSEDKTDRVCG